MLRPTCFLLVYSKILSVVCVLIHGQVDILADDLVDVLIHSLDNVAVPGLVFFLLSNRVLGHIPTYILVYVLGYVGICVSTIYSAVFLVHRVFRSMVRCWCLFYGLPYVLVHGLGYGLTMLKMLINDLGYVQGDVSCPYSCSHSGKTFL